MGKGAAMQTGQIYREVLVGIYQDYDPRRLPIWVFEGLLEEGIAERDGTGGLRLTTEGEEFSATMISEHDPNDCSE